jgi:predicted RNase H-like HicB family nuclease
MGMEERPMTVPVFIEQTDGQFCASLVGSPEVHCVRPTRSEAITALQQALQQKLAAGELVDLELQPVGVSGLSGRFRDDPTLREICDEIYRQRDAQQAP